MLRHKGKRRKPSETLGKFNIGKTIRQRPKEVRKRESFGHWELDTVVSIRGKSKSCVATFAERKTRLYLAVKMADRTSTSMEKAFAQIAMVYPQGVFQTATVDRGKEFACHKKLEATHNIEVYVADPYSSWQRGTKMPMAFCVNFSRRGITLLPFQKIVWRTQLDLINNRPRKCLGWKTAYESFMSELSHLA